LREGDRVGIFAIHYLSDKEVLLEDCDRHLAVCLSVYRTGGKHSTLKWLYMLPVVPMHKLVARYAVEQYQQLIHADIDAPHILRGTRNDQTYQ
jgi:hypothetical protein